jgi:organic hydroperoxide reductase OsmC/OhrA
MTTEKKFLVKGVSPSGIQTSWECHLPDKNQQPIKLSIPPEFEGPGEAYSPEDLYALALMNCFIATFKFVAEKSRLEFQSIEAEAILTVDKGERTSPWMQKVEIHLSLKGAPQPERALTLLEKTKKNCMIINSVQTEVAFHFQVSGQL